MKKELTAPLLAEPGNESDGKKKIEVEMIAQKAQKASGALFGSPPGEGTVQPETLSNKLVNFIAEIKYATSGDD